MSRRLMIFCVALVLTVTTSARADIIFGTGISGAATNIGAFTEQTSTTATGRPLLSVDDVISVLTDEDLDAPAMGAARIEAVGDLFTTVVFEPLGPVGKSWTTFEFNPQIAPGGATGTFTLQVLDNQGDVVNSGVFALGNGNNRVWAKGINGQVIEKITITASSALIHDIQQIRIDAIPEPSTFAFAGIALLGGMSLLVRRKRLKNRIA